MNQQVNLLAPIFRRQPTVLSARLALLLCGLLVALLGVVQLVSAWQATTLTHEQARLEARRDGATDQLNQLAEQIRGGGGKSQQLVAERDRLAAEANEKRQSMAALSRSELGNTTGFSPQFIGFARQRLPGLWLTGIRLTVGGREMELQGVTLDEGLLPHYLDLLGTESVFRGSRFGHAELKRNQGDGQAKMQFTLRSQNPEAAPAQPLDPS